MNGLPLALGLFFSVAGWLAWWWFKPRPWLRHQRCLENIERLERELFPEWFQQAEKVDWCMEPGARWLVDSHNYVQSIPPLTFVQETAALCQQQRQADLAARNLAFSAEMKRAEIHQQFWGAAP